MSKFSIGVGEDFPLDQAPEGCRGRHGRHGRRHRRHHHGHHRSHGHHHAQMMALLSALKQHRCDGQMPADGK